MSKADMRRCEGQGEEPSNLICHDAGSGSSVDRTRPRILMKLIRLRPWACGLPTMRPCSTSLMRSIGSRSSPRTIWSRAASRLHYLERIRERFPLVMHGVSLSIGSTDPDRFRVSRRRCARWRRASSPHWISDHLCWTGVEGRNVHDLLPLPYTEEALATVVARVGEVQERLGRQILLENVSSYLTFHASEMSEWEFLSEVAAARRLRHLARHQQHLCQQRESRLRPADATCRPSRRTRVRQFHLAGHSDMGGHLIDTHDHPDRRAGVGALPRGASRTSARCRP